MHDRGRPEARCPVGSLAPGCGAGAGPGGDQDVALDQADFGCRTTEERGFSGSSVR